MFRSYYPFKWKNVDVIPPYRCWFPLVCRHYFSPRYPPCRFFPLLFVDITSVYVIPLCRCCPPLACRRYSSQHHSPLSILFPLSLSTFFLSTLFPSSTSWPSLRCTSRKDSRMKKKSGIFFNQKLLKGEVFGPTSEICNILKVQKVLQCTYIV